MKRIMLCLLIYLFLLYNQVTNAGAAPECDSLVFSNTSLNFEFINQEQLRRTALALVKLENSLSDFAAIFDSQINPDSNLIRNIESDFISKKAKIEKFKTEFQQYIKLGGQQAMVIYEEELARQSKEVEQKFKNSRAESKRKAEIITKDVWNLQQWKIKYKLGEPDRKLYDARISPDGNIIAAKENFNSGIILFEIKTGKVLHELKWQGLPLTKVAFSPDSKSVLTVSHSKSDQVIAVLWDIATGKDIL